MLCPEFLIETNSATSTFCWGGIIAMEFVLEVPKALISWDSVSGKKPYLKEMLGHTLICGANPPTPSVSCFSLLKNLTLSVVPKARMAIEYSSP